MRQAAQRRLVVHPPWSVPDWLEAGADRHPPAVPATRHDSDAAHVMSDVIEAAEEPAPAPEAICPPPPEETSGSREALADIAAWLATSSSENRAFAEAAASRMAGILVQGLTTAFPALEERFGPDEARAFMQALLPGLTTTRGVVVRVAPTLAQALEADLAELPAAARATPAATAGRDAVARRRAGGVVRRGRRA